MGDFVSTSMESQVHFQSWINEILKGQEGVFCHMDNVHIFGHNQQENEAQLQQVK